MSIFPFLNGQAGIEDYKKQELPLFREIAWDFRYDKPIFENGDFKTVEGNKALEVWIYKAIKTDRFELNIYSWNYGSEINRLISQGYSKGYIDSETKRYISEALLINKYIKEVKFKSIEFDENTLKIDIEVKTIYGNMRIKL